ncbi:MAG TPA: hypothetical protein VIL73_08570 [Gaiellaceae bacterium]|jgi:hypothetical protein
MRDPETYRRQVPDGARVADRGVGSAVERTLLRVDAPEWEAINRDATQQAIAWARDRTIEESIAAGMGLSRTAHAILVAVGSGPVDAGPA